MKKKYNKWLETPSGELNPNYKEQNIIYNEKINKYKDFQNELIKRNLKSKPFKDYTEEETFWYNQNKQNYVYENKPNKCKSNIRAYLGNGGECFEEEYTDLYLMKEYVENGYVEVTEVDKSFFDYFHKAKLNNLSLTNIFEIDQY